MTEASTAMEQPRENEVALRSADSRTQLAAPTAERTEFDKILALAENPNIPIERISQVIDLFQKVEREKARRAFEAAVAAAKAEFGPIVKRLHVEFDTKSGTTRYDHEDLAEIERAVTPALSRNGLSYRWQTSAVSGQPVKVTCIVTHVGGYYTETTLESGRDDSGGKNAIQAIASALTYLQRYTLRSALGLAVSRRDDDGRAAAGLQARIVDASVSQEPVFISCTQAETLSKLITTAKADVNRFLAHMGVEEVSGLLASQYEEAVSLLNKRIERNRAEVV